MTSLKSLLLGNCRRLESIKYINGLNELAFLHIESCSKIEDYDCLTRLPNLKTLYLINCKDIKSISFVRNFPSLETIALTGTTNVLDGDMEPIQHIKKIAYNPRKHYNLRDLNN